VAGIAPAISAPHLTRRKSGVQITFPTLMSDIPKTSNPRKVLVIGPTGLGGSAITIELLKRGHHVTGMSRNPQRLGNHPNYSTISVDLTKASFDELTKLFQGYDVVVEYIFFQTLI